MITTYAGKASEKLSNLSTEKQQKSMCNIFQQRFVDRLETGFSNSVNDVVLEA